MATPLAALIWVLGLAFLWWRAEPLIVRLLTHMETQATARIPQPPAALPPSKPMPIDLRIAISEYRDEWARDQELQRANELYGQYQDWDLVRAALGAP